MNKIKYIHAISAFSFGINNVNRGEDGIQKQIPQLNRSYISGDKILYCINETVRSLNNDDPNKNNTYLSSGDKRSDNIENDIASDMNGYMLTNEKDNESTDEKDKTSVKRKNKSSAKGKDNEKNGASTRCGIVNTASVLSSVTRDDLFNFKMRFNTDGTSHMPINETLSVNDEYLIPFKINKIADISFDLNNRTYVNDEVERKRRINLYLNGFVNLQGLACQHNATVNNMATYVKYVISSTENIPLLTLNQHTDTDLMRYKQNTQLIDYQVSKGNAVIFEGGVDPITNQPCRMNVIEAMEAAQKFISENRLDTHDC